MVVASANSMVGLVLEFLSCKGLIASPQGPLACNDGKSRRGEQGRKGRYMEKSKEREGAWYRDAAAT